MHTYTHTHTHTHARTHTHTHTMLPTTAYSKEDRSSQSVTWCQLRWWGVSETRKEISLDLIWRWQVLLDMTCLFPDFTPAIRLAVPCMDASIDCCQREGPGGEHYPGRSETPRWPGEDPSNMQCVQTSQFSTNPLQYNLELSNRKQRVNTLWNFKWITGWASVSIKQTLSTPTLF